MWSSETSYLGAAFIWDLINHCLRIWCRSMIKNLRISGILRYSKVSTLYGKRLFLWLPKWQFLLSKDWLVGRGAIGLWLPWEMQDRHFCLCMYLEPWEYHKLMVMFPFLPIASVLFSNFYYLSEIYKHHFYILNLLCLYYFYFKNNTDDLQAKCIHLD